jgi:predicted enzyme related to lactoylglutathione lyase
MATKKTKSAIRTEGLNLAVNDVKRSVAFYGKKLGLKIEIDSAPHFALVRVGPGASIGLLAARHALPKGIRPASKAQHAAIHLELSTDDLDGLYRRLKVRGDAVSEPPHDEEWERSA